jgi:hypothetical protein
VRSADRGRAIWSRFAARNPSRPGHARR